METAYSRFRRIVEAHPNRPALVSDADEVSYREFHRRSAEIAEGIRRWFRAEKTRAITSTDVIGICMDKCTSLYATIFGILETGASYVPLDPDMPLETRQDIVDKCGCQLIIAIDAHRATLGRCAVLSVDQMHSIDPSSIAQTASILSTDLCYSIFTSGTTGKPKGVMVNHGNVINLVNWATEYLGITSSGRALQYSTVNFDASILDIFPTLLSGAALCIPTASQRLSAKELAAFCRRHGVDRAFLPPTLLAVLNPGAFETISTLLTGGEACSPQVLRGWSNGRHLYNLYGPTECTVLATCRRMSTETSPRNLGTAITGVRLHVLDSSGRPTSRGELYIAGLSVSPGYVEDSEATAARYVRIATVDSSVLYRTGDIVELDAVGELHFVGRMDRQVKVRGYRVELDEIESALLEIGCREAAVKISSKETLVAYVSSDETLDLTALKSELAKRLSDFKIPQHLMQLPRLPLKTNGKVDYFRLPETEPNSFHLAANARLEEHYVPIAELWSKVLSIEIEKLHGSSNFRDLGGTSLNIVSLLNEMESSFGVSVSFIAFFRNPTIDFLYQSFSQHLKSKCSHH